MSTPSPRRKPYRRRLAVMLAIVVGVTALGSSGARAGAAVPCSGGISSDATYAALVIPSTAVCIIASSTTLTVTGNVTVGENARLFTSSFGSLLVGGNVSLLTGSQLDSGINGTMRIEGRLEGDHASVVSLMHETFIGRGADIGFTTQAVSLVAMEVGGNVSIHDTNAPLGGIFINFSSLGGHLTFTDNEVASLVVTNNTIARNLICFGNTISSTFEVDGNAVGGFAHGQCAGA